MVKGLDYALLQKVKAQEEVGDEDEDENRKGGGDGDDDDEDDEEEGRKKDKDDTKSGASSSVDPVIESAEQRIKMNLKPKILPKTASAAFAAALNKSLTDNPFAFKKYLESAKTSKIKSKI